MKFIFHFKDFPYCPNIFFKYKDALINILFNYPKISEIYIICFYMLKRNSKTVALSV